MTDDAGRVLAVDLVGTNIRVALVDTSGGTAGFVVAPTDAAKGPASHDWSGGWGAPRIW